MGGLLVSFSISSWILMMNFFPQKGSNKLSPYIYPLKVQSKWSKSQQKNSHFYQTLQQEPIQTVRNIILSLSETRCTLGHCATLFQSVLDGVEGAILPQHKSVSLPSRILKDKSRNENEEGAGNITDPPDYLPLPAQPWTISWCYRPQAKMTSKRKQCLCRNNCSISKL